jgi:hypothetical protein
MGWQKLKAGSGALLLLVSLSLFLVALVKSGGRPSVLVDAIRYAENGQFPTPIINPAAGLVPVAYLPNGLFPEPAEP